MPGWHFDMQFAADSFRIITSLLLWKSLISRPLAVVVALPVAELRLQEFPPLISLFFIFCWNIWQLLFLIFSPASSQQCRWRSNGCHYCSLSPTLAALKREAQSDHTHYEPWPAHLTLTSLSCWLLPAAGFVHVQKPTHFTTVDNGIALTLVMKRVDGLSVSLPFAIHPLVYHTA